MSILTKSPSPNNKTDAQFWAQQRQHVLGILDEWQAAFEQSRQVVSVYLTAGPDDIVRRAEARRDIPVQRMAIASLRRELADIGERLAAKPEARAQAIEIDGRAYRVTDRLTIDELQRIAPRAAEMWRRARVAAHVEVRLAHRGRRPYVAIQYQDGTYSAPFRSTLTSI